MKATSFEGLNVSIQIVACFPQERKFSKNARSISELGQQWSKGAAAQGKEGVPYHMLKLVQSPPLTL